MALAIALAAPAQAQCAPDPTTPYGTTTCTGTDADGLRVTTAGTRVSVAPSAIVLGSGGPAIAVRIASDAYNPGVTLSVAGRVDGGVQAGVSHLWQPSTSVFGYDQFLGLTVLAGGVVTGTNGVVAGQASSGYGRASVTIDNAGTISGTGGVALLSTAPTFAGFSSITNRQGGSIGAISAPVGTLANAGIIDGGTRSAIDWGTNPGFIYYGDLGNTGTIASAGNAATLANVPSGRNLTNSGTVANSGTGTAIAGSQLTIANAGGGRIASAGAAAIRTDTYLQLVNAGTIDGNVVTAAAPGYTGDSTVDSTAGRINGSVTFGAGFDTLVATYNGGGLSTGITGAIDGGEGTDTVRVRLAADTTLATPLVLPANFEQLSLAPDAGVTATLADGFAASAILSLAGAGTIVNRTTLSGARQAVLFNGYDPSGSPVFVNAGTITTTGGASGTFAAALGNIRRFENSGTIAATGDGVSFGYGGYFLNSGAITAAGTAASLFGPYFTNSGTIRSTGGTGVVLSGSYGSNWSNSGLIEGAIAGARISSNLVNTGVIASAGTGVVLDWYGVLDNRAGGVVSGGTAAIGAQNGGSGVLVATVANAGTINGNVAMVNPYADSYNANRFFALPGGMLNGNLTLGPTDTLIAELANDGPGAFAGIAGTVSGTGALLRYRVRGDASASLSVPGAFAGVGYDLFDGATLTLTGVAGTRPLQLAGRGSVDLTADIATTTQPAIRIGSVQLAPGEAGVASGLGITSRGTLTVTRADSNTYPYAAVALGTEDSLTNVGAIVANDRAGTFYSSVFAIVGGKDVVNSGTITLDGTIGVQSTAGLTNSGSIVQAAGGRAAAGVRGVRMLVNSGTIDVAGVAVQGDGLTTIRNSGRIASSGGAAITGYAAITNQAGGTIAGASGQAAILLGGGSLANAGTITGTVDLGYSPYGPSYSSATYIADGGTIAGDLRFGNGDDTLISFGGNLGVSGTIDGGSGIDTVIYVRRASDAVTLGTVNVAGFEAEGVGAFGSDTVVTVRADAPIAGDLALTGDGAVVNTATIAGAARAQSYYAMGDPYTSGEGVLAAFTNQGTIAGGFSGQTRTFANTGTIGATTLSGPAVAIDAADALSFSNAGRIAGNGAQPAVALYGWQATDSIAAANSGSIEGGGVQASLSRYAYLFDTPQTGALSVSLTNSGTITDVAAGGEAVRLALDTDTAAPGAVTLDNGGTIDASGSGASAVYLSVQAYNARSTPLTIAVTNAGTIRANGGGSEQTYTDYWSGETYRYTVPAIALQLEGGTDATATVINTATGVIEAVGARSTAITTYGAALDLANAGIVRGGSGTMLAADDVVADSFGLSSLAGAIQTIGDADDRIVNSGTIIGSVDLGAGNDRIENYGRIAGDVFLGFGDDTLLHRAGATLTGIVDGGLGLDSLIIDAAGGGAVDGDRFVNFERFSQTGVGNVVYSGRFRFDTIGLSGGTVTVAKGETLTSAGGVTVTGSDADETVVNDGTIAGSLDLAGGGDRVVNRGAILGSVALGSGDDTFVDGAGSRVAGSVDGGAGSDLYTVLLAGNRTGIGGRTGFERLSVDGEGTLSLALDQRFEAVALSGTGLNLALGRYTVGAIAGSDDAETLAVDGDVASVALGGGNDTLAIGAVRAEGTYGGGAGNDTLRFTATAPVTLAGNATGFEQLVLAANALSVTGTLGSADATLSFGDGAQQLTVANGGTLAGTIDLGAGDDGFRLAARGTLAGSVSGGAGNDRATIELAGDRTLGGVLRDVETLATEGSGTLTLTGAHRYDRLVSAGNLTIAADGVLSAGQVQFGATDDRFSIAGAFAGGVDGGAGTDTIAVSGGSAAAPVALSGVTSVEAYAQSGGYATVAGAAAVGSVDLTSGRLVGLSGSTITAPQIAVRQGATFGSAGIVTGNIAVAGTLSPGASPGTMTVNGNVAIAGGSVSVFELTPTISDKLVVNGAVSIASGATLQLVPTGALRPGTSYDLIVASGGIAGSYSTVVKPDTLFGLVIQRADRIQLLGQFVGDGSFSPQVSRSIAYANATLAVQPATSTLFAALPALLTPAGASDPHGFAQLTPEAYASATQIGVDDALTLTAAARGPAFATTRDDAGLFTFAQTVGQWHTLSADPAAGSANARTRGYGFLGGLGYGDSNWSVGAFGGYLNTRQGIEALGARTKADGVVAGVHGRYAHGGLGLSASILYDGGTARTTRALPGVASASGRYDLHSWAADVSVRYDLGMGTEWTLQPRLGITYLRTTRNGATETGGPFALTVARDRHVAGFADAGFGFGRSEASTAAFRPFVGLGLRYQIEGRRADALAGYAGGPLALTAVGASRARVVGTASAGLDYRVSDALDLFSSVSAQSGRDDHQETVSTGVRLRF